MTRSSSRYRAKIPVGVFALTLNMATTLAQELNVALPLTLCPASTVKLRGQSVSALLVASECWPLSYRVFETIAPALQQYGADILRVQRIDPRKPMAFATVPSIEQATGYQMTNLATVSDHGMMVDTPTYCPGSTDPRCKGLCTVDGRDNKIKDPDCFRGAY